MSHYFSQKQESPLELKKVDVVLRGKDFSFFSGNGVFSKDKIDFGTVVLANYMQIGEKERVLDLGCGIGVVGRVALTITKGEVVFVDTNLRALQLTKKNVKGFVNTKVFFSDVYEKLKGEKFDVILLNPPQTAGKKVCFKMIEDAKEHLLTSGSLQVVARHNKGGEVLNGHMKEVFGNMETLAKKGGYRVYKSVL